MSNRPMNKCSTTTLYRQFCQLFFVLTLSSDIVLAQVTQPAVEPKNAVRLQEINQIVLGHLRNGDLALALKSLEFIVDANSAGSLMNADEISPACAGLNRGLAQLDAEARFELLNKWSMPADAPPRIRILTALVPTVSPPIEFARALGERPRSQSFVIASIGDVPGIFSSAWSLVVAARESGKLKRLIVDLGSMVEKNVENAELLLGLAQIADGRGDLSKVIEQLTVRLGLLKHVGAVSQPIDVTGVVLAVAGSQHSHLRSAAEALLETLVVNAQGPTSGRIRAFLRHAHAAAILAIPANQKVSGVTSKLTPQLKYWIPVSTYATSLHSPVATEGIWLTHEDHILHLSGSGNDALLFRYPLRGDFQFQCETQIGATHETRGALVYCGFGFQAMADIQQFHITDSAGAVLAKHACPFIHPGPTPTFNRLSVSPTENSLKVSVNLHPAWTYQTSAQQSPWLGFSSLGDSRPLFRNIKWTGHPIIPRSVGLISGNDLRGWQTQLLGTNAEENSVAKGNWSVADGQLRCSKLGKNDPEVRLEEVLSYHRPLLEKESVSFEFFYEPGETEVSPICGRVAFLLQPEGVKIHWVTDGERDWSGLAIDNSLAEPLNRRGPRPLPLKAKDWNRVTLARTETSITLSLNDAAIYHRLVDWSGDHRFGFYRLPAVAVQVRNIVLTGDWPESIPTEFMENPTVDNGDPLSFAYRHGLDRIFEDHFFEENVFAIRRKALGMSIADRYEFLSRWILPGSDHPVFRIIGDFTQTQPAPVAMESGVVHPELGGEIISPIFDWLDAAKELRKLPDCLRRVTESIVPDGEYQQRARIGLLLLLNLELGDQQAVTDNFEALYKILRTSTVEDQWTEMLVMDRGSSRFAENSLVTKFIADVRTMKLQKPRPSRNSLWNAHMGSLLGRLEAKGGSFALKDWIATTAATSLSRGQGHPVAHWVRNDHQVLKRVTHEHDFLFYRSPLKGNYEIECDLIDVTQLLIGGSYVGARSDRTSLELGTFRAATASQVVDPPFSPFGQSVHFRAVIRDGIRMISFNGRPVTSDKLPDHCDPWIAIRCSGRSFAGVNELRIMGNPQVLDAVRLSDSKDLTGWISYHEEPVVHDQWGWTHVDDSESSGWIVGHPNSVVAETSIEGLLRYQRPLVEDGSIEYEFFYEPDQFETHLALDRLAFILNPLGVREHWIGDGRYDRTDLEPDNMSDHPECRRGPAKLPLKSQAWNQLKLLLRGTTAAIELNGQLVYERNLEPTNKRTFGLFHFLGKTSVRVRNAVMRGDWPKTVPTVATQELASDATDRLEAELAGLKSVFSHNFQKDGIPDKFFKPPLPHTSLRIIPGPHGVQASQRSVGPHAAFNIIPRFTLCGDFDIEVSFTGLRIEGTGDSGVMLNAMLDGELKYDYRALRMKTTPGYHEIQSSLSIMRPDGGRTYVADSKPFESISGRIRLARRGLQVFYLFAEANSDHFLQFGSEPASDAETAIDGVFLHSFCNGISISQVTWTKLVLRADRIKWYSQTPPPPQEYLSVTQADGTGLRTLVAPKSVGFSSVASPELSPDRRKIVMEMSNGTQATSHVFIVNTSGTELKDLGVGCMPSFSGDGNKIVCSVPGTGIVTMQSDGTAREVIAAAGWGAHWSPDGSLIAFAEGDNITLFDVKSGNSRQLLKGDTATRYRSIVSLAWSHNGRSIAFKAHRRDIIREELILVGLDSTGEFKVLHPNAHAVTSDIAFSPDNLQVIVGIKGLSSHEVKLFVLNCNQPGPAVPFLSGPLSNHKVSGFAWSHDGKSVAITSSYSAQFVEWINEPNLSKDQRQ